MSTLPFVLSILALLLTPGPTNTLLAVGAASAGFRHSLPLVLAELTAYLLVVTPLATVAAGFLTAFPLAAVTLKACSAAWILFLAIRLWLPQPDDVGDVSARHVFVTTLLNPKAVVIGLVIMPHGALTEIAGHLCLFAGLIVFASLSWLLFGAFALARAQSAAPQTMRRIASVILAGFSVLLTSSLIA